MKKLLLVMGLLVSAGAVAATMQERIAAHRNTMDLLDMYRNNISVNIRRFLVYAGGIFFYYSNPEISTQSELARQALGNYGKINLESWLGVQGAGAALGVGVAAAGANRALGAKADNKVTMGLTALAAAAVALIQNNVYGQDGGVPYYDSEMNRYNNMFAVCGRNTLSRVLVNLLVAAGSYCATDWALTKMVNKYQQCKEVAQEEIELHMQQYLIEKRPDILLGIMQAAAQQQSVEQYFQDRPEIAQSLLQEAEAFAKQRQAAVQ